MGRIDELDGLRAIAVLAVVMFHAGANPLFSGGFLGVDVFFVLSGFLITAILAHERDETGRIALSRFYWHRFLRLSPAYFALIAAYLVAAPFLFPDYGMQAHARDAAVAATYLSDYGYAFWDVPLLLRHSWSLAVEEHFYIVWPLLLGLVMRSRSPWCLLLGGYLVFALWRGWNFAVLDWQLAYYRFDTRFAGMVLGAALALWLRGRGEAQLAKIAAVREWLMLAGLVMLALALAGSQWDDAKAIQAALPAAELATVLLILAVVADPQARRGPIAALLASRPMVRLGVLSYGIYLWHFPVSLFTRQLMDYWPSLVVCLTSSVALAWLSYETVERAGRRVRAGKPLLAPDRQRQASATFT